MSVAQIIKKAPPVKEPIHTGSPRKRKKVESQLGFGLPDDYYEFCSTYGRGLFEPTDMWVFDCFEPNYLRDLEQLLDLFRNLRAHAAINPDMGAFPYNVFPTRPGLSPWGKWRSDDLFWLIDDRPPMEWPTIVRFREDVQAEWRMDVLGCIRYADVDIRSGYAGRYFESQD